MHVPGGNLAVHHLLEHIMPSIANVKLSLVAHRHSDFFILSLPQCKQHQAILHLYCLGCRTARMGSGMYMMTSVWIPGMLQTWTKTASEAGSCLKPTTRCACVLAPGYQLPACTGPGHPTHASTTAPRSLNTHLWVEKRELESQGVGRESSLLALAEVVQQMYLNRYPGLKPQVCVCVS